MSSYTIKFYPEYCAFTLDPAPPHDSFHDYLVHGDRKAFKWHLSDGDILTIDWNPPEDGSDEDHVYLEVAPYFYSHRERPFLIIDPSGNQLPEENKPNSKVKLPMVNCRLFIINANNGTLSMWGFDFCYKTKDKYYRIDPEIKVGSGTNSKDTSTAKNP